MRRIPPLAAVRVFEAAARYLNFTRAAAELGMTQAAVSYQVKLLEERLGTKLFVREGRGLVLSETGRRLAPQVIGAFDLLNDAFGSVRTEAETILRINAPTSIAANWLAGRLGAFQLSRPGLAVRLEVEDRVINFALDEADVALRFGSPPWPGVRHEFLMRLAVAPFASPAFLAAHPPIREAADIMALPRLPDDEWWALWQCAAGVEAQPESDAGPVGVRFDSQVLAGNAAINGHGVAVLTPAYWQNQIAAGQLVQLWPVAAVWNMACWLVYPETKRNLPKVTAFRDWLMAEAKASANGDQAVLTPPLVEA